LDLEFWYLFFGQGLTVYVDLPDLELTELFLPLSPQCKLELKVYATMSSHSNPKHSRCETNDGADNRMRCRHGPAVF